MVFHPSFAAFVALSLSSLSISQTTGSFSVLSYNVAGLPEFLSSGTPAVNTPLISPRLAPYDIINVQEDFNYHAALYADDNHPHRTPTSGGAGIGQGLNTLSNFPYVDLERVKWDKCNLNSGDCLTPKGFTFVRTSAADGLIVDVYNLHTDAGSDDGDLQARASNFAQLKSFIDTWSSGFPVVVMGDTNGRYTRDVDGDSLRNFVGDGLVDSWVEITRGGSPPPTGTDAIVCPFPFSAGTSQVDLVACEVVDKIFVRSSEVATLTATTYTNENDAFLNGTSYPLSDHYPISSIIQYTLSDKVRLGNSIGGPHGDVFNDVPTYITNDNVPTISGLTLRGANRVDGLVYTLGATEVSHGGNGGDAYNLDLSSGQHVVSVEACAGQYSSRTRIFFMSVTTNEGETLEAGKRTDDCLTSTAPEGEGWGLVGFWGRSGNEVDRIAPIWGRVY